MLQATLRRAATLVIALATLAACDAEPLAPHAESPALLPAITAAGSASTVYRDDGTVPFAFVIYASCANGGQGEVLQAIGALQYKGHSIISTNGQRTHYFALGNFTGTAVGWDSGETYDIASREITQGNTDYGTDGNLDSLEEMQRFRLDLASRTTGAVIQVVLVGRYVQTATGEFVLDGWEGSSRCD